MLDAKTWPIARARRSSATLTTDQHNEIGATTGLAWTEVGGQILTTEVHLMEGKGKLTITGKLGDVMQESAQAAISYIRSRALTLGPDARFLPQPGRSPAHSRKARFRRTGRRRASRSRPRICSALTEIPVRGDLAMTGEITFAGKVLPIGGLKEKLLAAHRHGINEVIIPKDNQKDLPDIPEIHPQCDEAALCRHHG